MLTRPIRDLQHASARLVQDLQADSDHAVILMRWLQPVLHLQLCTFEQAEWAIEDGALQYPYRELCIYAVRVQQELEAQPDPKTEAVIRFAPFRGRPLLWGFLSIASADSWQSVHRSSA